MSTYEKEMQITHAVLNQANFDLPKSGYDTTHYYYNLIGNRIGGVDIVRQVDDTGLPRVNHNSYHGYLLGDGLPPNGAPFTSGIVFPLAPVENQYCLRTDYLPNRLFQFINSRWKKVEESVRMTETNLGYEDTAVGGEFTGQEVNQTQRSSFVNNNKTAVIDGHVIKEKQSLSKALRPEADN